MTEGTLEIFIYSLTSQVDLTIGMGDESTTISLSPAQTRALAEGLNRAAQSAALNDQMN